MSYLRRLQAKLAVEPVVFFYFFWMMMMFPVMSLYIYVRISDDKGFPYMNISRAEGGCDAAGTEGNSSALKYLEIEVQRESANLFTYYIISATIPTMIVAPFIGSYTDRGGRKPGLVVPLVGAVVETALTLVMMYLRLPLWVFVIGGVINGLTGSITAIMLSVMAYIADVANPQTLSFRFALMQFTMALSAVVSQLTSGLWIENLGFKNPLWFVLGCLSVVLVYVIFFLQETRQTREKEKIKETFSACQIAARFFKVFTKHRAAGRSNLWLILLLLGINILATVGTGAVQLLYVLLRPLCWGPSIIGYYLSYRFFAYGLGGAVMVPVLKRCFVELNVVRLGYLSQIAALLLFAFSNQTWIVFIVPAVAFIAGVTDPIFYGMTSKIVSPEEQGSLFAAVGILSAIGELLGTTLFNSLYPLSLEFEFPGFVFVLSAGIFLIVLILTIFLDVPPDILGGSMELVDSNQNVDVTTARDVMHEIKPDSDAPDSDVQTKLWSTSV